jgi:CheY-like chemotaxis protein
MTPEQLTGLVESMASLIQALVWPFLLVFAILYFGAALKKFLNDIGELTIKGTGWEASAKRQQLEAAASLGAAAASQESADPDAKPQQKEERAREIANIVSQAVRPTSVRRLSNATALWVDDHPANNVYPRRALEAIGIRFTTSLDTTDALEKLERNTYDVIISDMGRPPDNRAGLTLLEELQKHGIRTPVVIYASTRAMQHKSDITKRGGFGATSDPQELFELVINAVLSK